MARAPAPDLSRPRESWALRVDAPHDRTRLDTFVHGFLHWRSRTRVQVMIREGGVLRLGRAGRPGERVRCGETITLLVPPPPTPPPDPSAIPLAILHEDRWLVALNKQPGVLVHPVGTHRLDTLINALHARYRRPDDPAADRVPKVCHRLDRDTSGVLVFSLDDGVRRRLGLLFEGRAVTKEYAALVWGTVREDTQVVDLPIGPDPDSPLRVKRRAGVEGGRRSQTEVEVLERFAGATLVAARPWTGRTHQIRVHLAGIGHPILGDALYGPGADPVRFGDPAAQPLVRDQDGAVILARQALHARRLRFIHPGTDAPLTLLAPLTADLEATIAAGRAGRLAPPAP